MGYGEIKEVDGDGDLLISFDGRPDESWVAREDGGKLSKAEVSSAADAYATVDVPVASNVEALSVGGFREGDFVVVTQSFASIDDDAVMLSKGDIGEIKEIDSDGDVRFFSAIRCDDYWVGR